MCPPHPRLSSLPLGIAKYLHQGHQTRSIFCAHTKKNHYYLVLHFHKAGRLAKDRLKMNGQDRSGRGQDILP